MKKLLAISFLWSILSACSGSNSGFQLNKEQLQKFMGLNGVVASIKDQEYDAIEKFGKPEIDYEKIGGRYKHEDFYIWTFNPNGFLIRYGMYWSSGNPVSESEFIYDGKKLVKTITTGQSRNPPQISSLIEREGDLEIWETSREREVVRIIEFTASDNYLSWSFKDKDTNITEKAEGWLDEAGNLLEAKMFKDEELVFWKKSKFNGNNEIETTIEVPEKEVLTYQYSDFDDAGNWTTKASYRDGRVEHITKREITYF